MPLRALRPFFGSGVTGSSHLKVQCNECLRIFAWPCITLCKTSVWQELLRPQARTDRTKITTAATSSKFMAPSLLFLFGVIIAKADDLSLRLGS